MCNSGKKTFNNLRKEKFLKSAFLNGYNENDFKFKVIGGELILLLDRAEVRLLKLILISKIHLIEYRLGTYMMGVFTFLDLAGYKGDEVRFVNETMASIIHD